MLRTPKPPNLPHLIEMIPFRLIFKGFIMGEKLSEVGKKKKKKQDLFVGSLLPASANPATHAGELAWIGEHAQAITITSQALEALSHARDIEAAQKSLDLLDIRAESYFAIGKLDLAAHDTALMVKLANAEKRPELKAQALNRKAFMQMRVGDLTGAVRTATTATKTKHTSQILCATSLFRLGEAQFRTGRNEDAIQTARQAISLFQSAGDKSGAGRAYWVMSVAHFYLSQVDESRRAAQTALELCQEAGDRYGIGNALIGFSNIDVDFVERIQHLHQALQAFEASGYTERKSVILVNLGLAYYELGLYPHARRLQSEAVNTSRTIGAKVSVAYGLINLVEAELKTNTLDMIQAHLDELAAITTDFNDPTHNATLAILLGDLALAEGNPLSAIQHYQSAVHIARQAGLGNETIFLTKLGQAYLADGSHPAAALKATTEATNLHRNQAFAKPDGFTTQEIWWCHARALSANQKSSESREALEGAYHLMLKSMTNLRDEGLRRNYLNKVKVNREIIAAWVEDGLKRNLPEERLFEHLAIQTNAREPFKRLVDTGLRLNTLHTVAEIQTFLVEEATELSGGERVLLILEKDHPCEVMEAILPPGEDAQTILNSIEPFLARTRLSRTVQLLSLASHQPSTENGGGERNCIVAPLIVQNTLLGYLYIEIDPVYGRFTEEDRDMVGLLANQAAVALNNAQWTQSLAQKVQERTGQFQERVNELQIINAIQQGFAAELDFQAVVDLIGDKLRQVFNTLDIGIRWYDEKANLVHYLYEYDHGERIEIPPRAPNPGGIWETMNRTRKPVIFNTPEDYRATPQIPGTDQSKSLISVPIISSDRILGSILLENY